MTTTFTPNVNLGKPDKRDFGYWAIHNANFDKIDALWASPSRTPGGVLYYDANSKIAVETPQFHYDYTNNRVGIGTSAPNQALEVSASGFQARLTNPVTGIYADIGCSVSGNGNVLSVDPAPADGTSLSSVRLFRFTNTTGAVTFQIAPGDNTNTSAHVLSGNGDSTLARLGGYGVGIGVSSVAATAVLELASTTKGFLPPRMTTTQRDAISSPATGLVIYNSTTNKLQVRTNSAWVDLH